MSIAILDVAYSETEAQAACVVTEDWTSASPIASYVQNIATVLPYEPGQFYRRELPCLLAVLGLLPTEPSFLVIDGYVWLADADRPGLGAHLHEALGHRIPVIGIAKSAFIGVENSPAVAPVLRGKSINPLYVTAIGIDLDQAARNVKGMHGSHRIPDLLKAVDRLSRDRDENRGRSEEPVA